MDTIRCILGGSVVAMLVYLFDKYFIKVYDYWRIRGIPNAEGTLPFVGNSISVLLLRKNFDGFCVDVYNAHPDRSMVGFFQFRRPCLLLRDPELVKTVLVSGFSNFHENGLRVDPKLDPLLALNPFFSDGDAWKTQRSRISSALMSNKKLKVLFSAVANVCDKFATYLDENVKKSNGVYEAETRELMGRFTGEVVATAGFGIEGNFFSGENLQNSFSSHIEGVFEPTLAFSIKQILLFFAPAINTFLGFSFLPKRIDRYFRHVINEVIDARRRDGIIRNDFLQLMLEAQKSADNDIDASLVTADAATFFLDGYDTSAITLAFFAYQVAANGDVQEKLRREIDTVFDKYDGEMTYEALGELTYMEQALNESMRLYPALTSLIKRCNEQCNFVGKDGIVCDVEVGTEIVINLRALHNDPEYWDNPEIYDPERFSEKNKNSRPKTVFLPFGDGPRICVGMRLAIMQIKAAMVTILRGYSIEVSPKTIRPVELKHSAILAVLEADLWINFRRL